MAAAASGHGVRGRLRAHRRPSERGPALDLGDLFNVERNLDTTIFMLLAIVGFGVLIVSYVFGEVVDVAGDLGADIAGDGDFGDGLLNIHTISAFLAGFGAIGWLFSGYWGVDPLVSAFGGMLGGLPLAGSVVFMGRMLQRQAGSTNFGLDELVGTEAIVTLRIAPGSVGYIEYRRAGGRHRAVARSTRQTVIPEGTVVRIERVVGGEVIVTTESQATSAAGAE
ncbi:MAG: hypothetical protein GEU80_03360 [Dehalococcoidia bacterium]|nr:hypothetical protein [Dehalococcoidia bacterium]